MSMCLNVVRKRDGWKIARDMSGLMADNWIVQAIQHLKWHFLMALSEVSETFESKTNSDIIDNIFAEA